MRRDPLTQYEFHLMLQSDERTPGNAAFTSAPVDVADCDSAAALIQLGVIADPDATFAVKLQESDQANAGFADVSADQILEITSPNFRFDDDGGVRAIGYLGTKKYIRLSIQPANNAGAVNIAATAVLTKIRQVGAGETRDYT